jgi:uncharacterized protein YjiS (DUF1127 family)
MTATRYSLHTPAPIALLRACKDAWRLLARALRRQLDASRERRRVRAALHTMRELGAMSDHQLRDLGFHRSELLSLAWNLDDATRLRPQRHL